MAQFRSVDSRGQMILMGALVLAVLFVGLALVLNSAIYTENISTRDVGGSAEAFSEDPPTEERLFRSLSQANYHSETADYDDRLSVVEANVSTWGTQQSSQSARSGRVRSSDIGASTEGTRITQSEHGEFMPADENLVDALLGTELDPLGLTGRTSWLTAKDVESRAFEATVEKESLKQVDSLQLGDLINWILDGNDPFSVVFEDDETLWNVYLVEYDDGNGDTEVAAVVTEDDGDEEMVGTCLLEGETATINFGSNDLRTDEERVSCPALSFTDDLDRHNIYFTGGTNAEGTYQFIIDKDEETFNSEINEEYSNLIDDLLGLIDCVLNPLDPLCLFEDSSPEVYSEDPDDEPYTTSGVYSVSVEFTYVDDRMTYKRNVTVAPEER